MGTFQKREHNLKAGNRTTHQFYLVACSHDPADEGHFVLICAAQMGSFCSQREQSPPVSLQ